MPTRIEIWTVPAFAVAFAVVWLHSPSPPSAPAARPKAARVADEGLRPEEVAVVAFLAPVAPGPPGAIFKSRLPEWMRFRLEHTTMALAVEMAVRTALDEKGSVQKLLLACASNQGIDATHDLAVFELSGSAEVVNRDVTVDGWGCDADGDPAVAGKICDCVLARLPSELHLELSDDVKDPELVPYAGLVTTRY